MGERVLGREAKRSLSGITNETTVIIHVSERRAFEEISSFYL